MSRGRECGGGAGLTMLAGETERKGGGGGESGVMVERNERRAVSRHLEGSQAREGSLHRPSTPAALLASPPSSALVS